MELNVEKLYEYYLDYVKISIVESVPNDSTFLIKNQNPNIVSFELKWNYLQDPNILNSIVCANQTFSIPLSSYESIPTEPVVCPP